METSWREASRTAVSGRGVVCGRRSKTDARSGWVTRGRSAKSDQEALPGSADVGTRDRHDGSGARIFGSA